MWDPHLEKNKDKRERVRRRAGPWISKQYGRDISVTSLLNQLRLESLEECQRICCLTFMHKILNQHVAVSPSDLDLLYNTRPVRGSVTTKRLKTIHCCQTAYQDSFAPKTVVQWNCLQDIITSAASVPSFRSQLAPKTCPHCAHTSLLWYPQGAGQLRDRSKDRSREYYRIEGVTLKWVQAFLTGHSQSVLCDGIRSRDEDI